MTRAASWLAVALVAAGCASTGGSPRSRPEAPEPRQESVAAQESERVAELQRQAAMAAAEIRLLRQNLAALQVEVERLAAEMERGAPAPPSTPSGVRFETSDLEPVTIAPPGPSARPAPEVVEVMPAPAPAPAAPSRPAAGANAPVPADGQATYDQGYTLYHQGRYVDAESAFQRFLQAHGGTELADNAQFWIGESRFARQDYRGALAAFQEVLDRYPEGNKVGDALLKTGDCMARLGDSAAAARRYRQVTERFPGSAAAVMAQERLARPGG